MKTSIEAMNQAAKGCGDCFLQDCDWPSCVPKVKEAIKHEESQSVESAKDHDYRLACESIRYADHEEDQIVEPYGWMMQGSNQVFKGEFAELDAKSEAKRCGGTCYAYPIYLNP